VLDIFFGRLLYFLMMIGGNNKGENAAPAGARVSSGLISWTGPLLLTVGRGALILISQAAAELIFMLHRDPSPWLSAGRWWTVYGTLADAGCLALRWRFTQAEGANLRDLIGPIRGYRARRNVHGLLNYAGRT
jgi:hypothetical protein